MTELSFDGQVAVVTGAGRGIGRAEALDLARRGAAVVVNDLAGQFADEVVAEIHAAGGRAVASYDTVATPEGGQAIVDAALEHFDGLDVLVNNAGILRCGYFDELTMSEVDEVLDVHLRAAFFVTRPAWSVMKAKRYGRIVMTSSGSGMFSHQGLSNYAAAKAGTYGLTKALAYEGADHGIKVNALLPVAATTISAENPIPDMAANVSKFLTPDDLERLAGRRDPALVAAMTTYLASRQCEPSGEAFSASGGRYARVFVGVAEGWAAPSIDAATPEAVAEHLTEIRDVASHTVPMWLFDESKSISAQLRPWASPFTDEISR